MVQDLFPVCLTHTYLETDTGANRAYTATTLPYDYTSDLLMRYASGQKLCSLNGAPLVLLHSTGSK